MITSQDANDAAPKCTLRDLQTKGILVQKIEDGHGGQNRNSLIGDFEVKTELSEPDYFEPFRGSGYVASVDMVRLEFRSLTKDFGDFEAITARYSESEFFRRNTTRPGVWQNLWSIPFGESSVALGFQLSAGDGHIRQQVGFLEFNPNKVAADEGFREFFGKVWARSWSMRLLRFDLAVDYPISRDSLAVVPSGHRHYKYERSHGITEYLGQRNTCGYVKVYDKAREYGLVNPLTRVEVTCSPDWDSASFAKRWPRVIRLDNVSGKYRMLAVAAQASGAPLDQLVTLSSGSDSTRKRMLKTIWDDARETDYSAPELVFEVMKRQAQGYAEGPFALPHGKMSDILG